MSDLISKLQTGRPIGSGQFGQVFAGIDPVQGDVAIKVMTKDTPKPETPAEWASRKAGLLKEGQALQKAQHPNVVRVFHILERPADDSILLVMERCQGGCLMSHYTAGPILLPDVRRIATDVTIGLVALHARGMIHRDIKPSNVLRDGRGRSKLGDFGLVTDDLILGYASGAGYADHVAPETWAGGGTSAKTDIWALGMTLYRLLHGADWYGQDPPPRTVVASGGYAKRLKWLPHIPKKWRRVISKMLRDDPADRYQSAEQLQKAFADLPIAPDWTCKVSPGLVGWSRATSKRKYFVEWTIQSATKHSWRAWSEPVGQGNPRAMGSSGGAVSRSTALKGLELFFESHAP